MSAETTTETTEITEEELKEQRKSEMKKKIIGEHNDYHVISSKEQLDSIERKKLNTWTIDGGGVYLTVKNKIGEFTAKVSDSDIEGLPDLQRNEYRMFVPKVPSSIYYQIQSFFIDIADQMNNAEAFVQVFYDTQEEKYVCHVPQQKVAGASVRYDAEETLSVKDPDRYIFVLEIHSHNTMDAFFSGVDDADEKETRFYGVFGKIKDPVPKFLLRFVVNESKPAVKPEQVFDFSARNAYPDEWKENVKSLGESTDVAHLDQSQASHIVRSNGYQWTGRRQYEGYEGYRQGWDSSEWEDDDYDSWYGNRRTVPKKTWDGEGTPGHVDDFIAEWKLLNCPEEVEIEEEEPEEDIRPPILKGQTTEEIEIETEDDNDEFEDGDVITSEDIVRLGRGEFYTGPQRDWRGWDHPSDDVPSTPEDWEEEDCEMSTSNMRDAVEDLEVFPHLEERWRIIEDFCGNLHEFDLGPLVEHLEANGYGDKVLEKLRAA